MLMKQTLLFVAAMSMACTCSITDAAGQATSKMAKSGILHTPDIRADGDATEWKLLGNGTFVDGWVIPGLYAPADYIDPSKYPFEVEIYESTTTPAVYKLKSPYTSEKFPFVSKNANTAQCDIIIDASDPEFVKVEPQNSGFVNNEPDASINYTDPFYIVNAGSYFLADGNSEADIIDYGYNSTMADGVITIVSPRFGKSADINDLGYMWQGEYNCVITLPEATTQPEIWEDLGMATYTDGFIYPGYFGDPDGNGWEVPVQQKQGTEGYYRLVNPYLAENPLSPANLNTDPAYIVIDATDPDNVLIAPQYSGFSDISDDSRFDYYIGNTTGFLHAVQNWSKDDIKTYLPQRLDKMADKVITITAPLFGNSTSEDGFGYQWVDENDEPIIYPAKIALPGATSGIREAMQTVSVDTAAETEYYTIQGIRTARPTATGVYICKNGTHVSKIIIK